MTIPRDRDPFPVLAVEPDSFEQVSNLMGVLTCAVALYEARHGSLPANMQHGVEQVEAAQRKYLEQAPVMPRQAFNIAVFQGVFNISAALEPQVLSPFKELYAQQQQRTA